MRAGLRLLRDAGDSTTFEGMDPDGPLPPFVTKDEDLSAMIDGTEYHDRKMAAMAAHATQITTDGPFFASPTTSAPPPGAWSSSGSQGGTAARSTRTASRRTCSPGSERGFDRLNHRWLSLSKPQPGAARYRQPWCTWSPSDS